METKENLDLRYDVATISDSLLSYCQSKGFALAIWRLPSSSKIQFLISYQPQLLNADVEVETLSAGFLLAEFEKGIKGEKYYLSADVSFSIENNDLAEIERILLFERLPGLEIVSKPKSEPSLNIVSDLVDNKNDFELLVSNAIRKIEEGKFKKVVLSRQKQASFEGEFSAGFLMDKINEKYFNTFNSLVYTPEHGTWIGASPETLVSKNADQLFKTVALAGTQKADGKTEKEANWSQKEIEEQAYVSRYIVERLKQIRLREFDDIGPKTVRVGNLFHLKTDFIVDLKVVDFPNLLGTMLHLLHPTSAVCGMPKDEAIDFVLQNEAKPRELYSGYFGPVNVENETFIFVNLRCAKLADTITFFAGAGITEDSEPEKEFLETELKMESLLGLF